MIVAVSLFKNDILSCCSYLIVSQSSQICQGSNQSWVEDPTNNSMMYARNRIRASLGNLSTEGLQLHLKVILSFLQSFFLVFHDSSVIYLFKWYIKQERCFYQGSIRMLLVSNQQNSLKH